MSDVVISVENVGKRYRLRHLAQGRRYTALRDVVADKLAMSWRVLQHRFYTGQHRANCHATSRSHNHAQRSELEFPRLQEDFWALKDVSFEITRGEVVGIIGRNGAGKSTLLKILSRITEPTTGEIEIAGRVSSLLEVGTGFHPELTGRENIFLNGAILGMTRAEIRSRFDEIVAFAGVERFLDTPVKRYSSGMYVRLAFAVAAHLEPEILIVDEVLAVGDAEFQKKCLGKLRSVSASGRTVLFVSHQLAMLRELCHRGIWMTNGKATTFDSITGALNHYLGNQCPISSEIDLNSRHVASIRMKTGQDTGAHIFFGDRLSITTQLRNLPCATIGLTVGFKNSRGRRLCLLATNPHDGVVLPQKRELEVTLVMQQCWFAPGEYLVDIAVTEPGVRIIEELTDAMRFEVHPSRLGGSVAYDSRFGEFFPPHSWEVVG